MPRGKKTDDATRAAIMAALLAGQGVTEVAESLGVPHPTVSQIKKHVQPHLDRFNQSSTLKNDIGNSVLELLNVQLKAIQDIIAASSERAYIQKQPASEVAVLLGVISDKAFRILSALEPESEGADGQSATEA